MFTSSQADDVRVTTNITRDRGARNVPYHVMWARWVRLGRDKEDRELGCIEVPAPPFASVPKSNRRRAKVSGSWLPSVATCVLVWVALFLAHRRRESLSFRYPLFQDQDDLSAMRQDMRKSGRDPKDPNTTRPPRRILDLTGVDEHITTIKQDWMEVISSFMDETPVDSYRAETIRAHYNEDRNNVKRTCMLVSIQEGNVTFREEYKPNHHSRAHSVKYVLNKIMRERGSDLPGATFLVMVTDGHRPRVPTFGSARHWKNWKMLTPVPLGNYRGLRDAWGTPFKGWDRHVDENIRSTKDEFVWATKIPKAVFRGTLAMQRHKLGSCNEENSGRCEAATKWNQVNRGVMYEQAMMEPQLFDIAFTQHKPKEEADYQQFEGAPRPGNKMPFKDFQKYKYIINAGSNQGKHPALTFPDRSRTHYECDHLFRALSSLIDVLTRNDPSAFLSVLLSTYRLGRALAFSLVHKQCCSLSHG